MGEVRLPCVSGADIQHSVGPKGDPAPIVHKGAGNAIENDSVSDESAILFTQSLDTIAQPVRLVGVVHVDECPARKLGVQREPQETPLPHVRHREDSDRVGVEAPVPDHLHPPWALCDECTAIGRKRDRPGDLDPAGVDCHLRPGNRRSGDQEPQQHRSHKTSHLSLLNEKRGRDPSRSR